MGGSDSNCPSQAGGEGEQPSSWVYYHLRCMPLVRLRCTAGKCSGCPLKRQRPTIPCKPTDLERLRIWAKSRKKVGGGVT